jgi:hypothetical protein
LRNDSFVISSSPDGIKSVYKLNLYGFRDRDRSVHGKSRRVMFVGDSFVEGYLTDSSNTIPASFESAAVRHGIDVAAFNLGVTGAGPEDYAQLILDAVPLFQPQDLVLVLFANDIAPRRFDPQTIEPATFPRTNRFLPRIVDVGVRLARKEKVALAWHRSPVPYFPRVPDPDNPWTGREADYGFVQPEIAAAMQSGLMNPFLVNEVDWYANALVASVDFGPFLRMTSAYLRRNNVRFFVVYLPCRHQVTNAYREYARAFCEGSELIDLTGEAYQVHAEALRRTAEELEFPFKDLSGPLREREEAGKRMYLLYDGHFRSETYMAAGEWIFEWWRTHNSQPGSRVTGN